jgi:predicted  nucleic acid-binding Zn-ribbon protein
MGQTSQIEGGKNRMKKWECKKCSYVFESGDEVLIAECPDCGSDKTKKVSLTPTKAFIKAFILYESVKCRECGRTLTSEKSIKRGFGPGCGVYYAEKWLDTHPKELGDRAKKRWTPQEVEALVKFAHDRKKIGN